MPTLQQLIVPLRSMAHYVDQPQVINGVHRFVQKKGIYGAIGLKAAYDLITAKPGTHGKVALEDGLVLGSTLATTVYGLNVLSEHADPMPPIPEKIKARYPMLKPLLNRGTAKARGYYSMGEIRHIITTVLKKGGEAARKAGHLDKIFPLPGDHHDSVVGEIFEKLFTGKLPNKKLFKALPGDKMVKFFGVGGLIVAAGLAGGLLFDKITGNKDKQSAVNKIKEGIFQFIANIAMCAVGASLGMTVTKILEHKLPHNKMLNSRGARFGIIITGLSLGIVWGGHIANFVGRRFVNPYFEWREKRDSGYTLAEALKNAKKENDRKIEFLDAILHLDDLPTALALAGVQIFVPFIPLFFAVSGYRTGIGYRNQGQGGGHHSAFSNKPAQPALNVQQPAKIDFPAELLAALQPKPSSKPIPAPEQPQQLTFTPMYQPAYPYPAEAFRNYAAYPQTGYAAWGAPHY